jgi:thiosulfate/3-mercaptopyruvate sulfurtransferase
MTPRLRRFLAVLCTAVFLAAAPHAVAGGEEKSPVLVTPAWLAAHLKDPDLVVLNVSTSIRNYREGHILGARFLWYNSFSAPTQELSAELVPPDRLDTLLEGLGVSTNSRIIVCGVGGNVSLTARAYVTLDYLGLGNRTSILDGGVEGWKAAGNSVTKETPAIKRGSLTLHLKTDAVVNVDFVKSRLNANGLSIVDARAPAFYNGIGGGFPRPGRIPGARNVYFSTLYDSTDRFLPLDSLRARFETAGVKPDDEVITYCHVGQTASSAYVAAKILGHPVHLYDGSFEDWSGREDLPVFVQPKPEPPKK